MSSPDFKYSLKARNCRYFKIGAFAIVFIVVIYTLVWYFLANKVEEKVAEQLTLYNENGFMALCENMQKTGYPLRIGVSCDTLNLQQLMKGFSFSSQKITAGAPVYAPHWLELSLQAPVLLELPGLVPLSAKWHNLVIETDNSNHIPDAISLRTDNIEIAAKADNGALFDKTTGKFLRFDAHGLNSNLVARLTFDELNVPLAIPNENTVMPQLSGDIRLSLENALSLFETDEEDNWIARLRGHKAMLHPSTIHFAGGGTMTFSGPLSFNAQGYLNAKLEISVSEQNKLLHTARDIFPSQADNLKTIFFALSAMPKNDKGDPVVQLIIKDGEVRLGFFKIGHVAPL